MIPWAALTVYLLQSRPRESIVPFLDLWPRADASSQSRHAWRFPPPAIAAALAAVFLAIFTAAAPQARSAHAASHGPLVVLVDRGLTMSAEQAAQYRFQILARASVPQMLKTLGFGRASLLVVPGSGEQWINRADLAATILSYGPTAADTRTVLANLARQALANPQALVVILTDQKIDVASDRLVLVSPTQEIENIGIADLSVRASPTPQVMVRLINDSTQPRAILRLNQAAPITIALPARGRAANYFVDLPSAPAVVEASIFPGGDIKIDDRAWAVLSQAWPIVEAHCPITAALQRVLEVYRLHRPPGVDSKTIAIDALDADNAAVLVLTQSMPASQVTAHIAFAPGPLTDGIDWTEIEIDGQVAQAQPGSDWRPIVWAGDRTLLATRGRQVWVGFRSTAWATKPDFVIFWTRVFDWAGQGESRYTSWPIAPLDRRWKPVNAAIPPADNGLLPGLYRRGEQLRAINATPTPLDPAPYADWQNRLARLADSRLANQTDLSWATVIAAIGCLALAAIALPRGSP